MARVDSILTIVTSQGANELRMGTDREPKMFAGGTAKKLSIPKTDDETLRSLLGEIFTSDREFTMRARGRFECSYDAGPTGSFLVTMYAREKGFDVVFLRKAGTGAIASRTTAPPAAERPAERPAPPMMTTSGIDVQRSTPVLELQRGSPMLEMPRAPSLRAPDALPEPIELDRPPPPSSTGMRAAPEHGAPLAQLVAAASLLRASDLHLADGEPPRVRIDGALRPLERDGAADIRNVLSLDSAERERLESAGSLDLAREIEGIGRVRVHAFRTAEGLAAAVRLLPRSAPTLTSLHLPVALDDLVELPHGLVLVCGATGSGKSTTLAALAQEALRRRSIVLTTLEDPIEYALASSSTSLVRRRQVRRDVKDFATGLRDALREDPDVLLVGEMRDPETISLAMTAAETGHLVLASMHSRSAASAVDRIVDSYPTGRESQIRQQLADSVRAIVAQRLLPKARGGGRVPALEVLRGTHAVAAMIREGRTAQIGTALQSGKKDGMLALERCLADKVAAGEVRLEDARAAANDPAILAMFLAK